MEDCGYSAIIDAILFLAMVSVCAFILHMAMAGEERQKAMSDAGLRATASSALASLEAVKADYFEYNILGDRAEKIAEKCGIDPGAWLYRETAKAVLGRANRHKTVMEIAAEDVACQFTLRSDGKTIRLNPLTGDYDRKARSLVDESLRGRLDRRYGYNFTLRWVPFPGVPMEGSLSCGKCVPERAATFSAYVTMPCRTGVTSDRIEEAIAPGLSAVEKAAARHTPGGSTTELREEFGELLNDCLNNTGRLVVKDFLNRTLDEAIPAGDVGNPLSLLATFSDSAAVTADTLHVGGSFSIEDVLCRLFVLQNSAIIDRLVDDISEGVDSGAMNSRDIRDRILGRMRSLYEPSKARATLSIWVTADA
jgi:hypothetical protein